MFDVEITFEKVRDHRFFARIYLGKESQLTDVYSGDRDVPLESKRRTGKESSVSADSDDKIASFDLIDVFNDFHTEFPALFSDKSPRFLLFCYLSAVTPEKKENF